ncbi:glycosyltransferase family 2 protein [Chloroflexota bacterium]
MSGKKLISIMSFCYNEEENVEDLHTQITQIMSEFPEYDFEHIYIDNASTDQTTQILRRMAAEDKRVKVIINARDFGHIRSPFYGLLQAHGDAVISMASDFQDPPYLIKEFIKKWEEGYKVVMGVKTRSQEPWLVFTMRTMYYRVLNMMAHIRLVENFSGFVLFDQQVVEILRQIDDPYPYFRGLIADVGFEAAKVEFVRPIRQHGITKNNFYTLFDMAMLGLTNTTKVPLRLATMFGFIVSLISFIAGLYYLIGKLIYWDTFSAGLAPLILGVFFLGGIQILFLGILGEYIGAIYTQVRHRPLVIEKERINID